MANIKAAIDYVLKFEDAGLTGVVTHTADGKRTRFGIDEHYHPELTNCLFFDSMGKIAALKIAEGLYESRYCQPLCIAEITNQEVANKLLSLGVNCGTRTAARMLQRALGVEGDGRIGPITLDRLDHADPAALLTRLKHLAEEHYEALMEENPALAVYKRGWLRRAEA